MPDLFSNYVILCIGAFVAGWWMRWLAAAAWC
jgi:hypothetical protein